MKRLLILIALALCLVAATATAEDGRRLWMRYGQANDADAPSRVQMSGHETLDSLSRLIVGNAQGLMTRWWHGDAVHMRLVASGSGGPDNQEAFCVTKTTDGTAPVFDVVASAPRGLLYAAFFMLRAQAMGDGCLCQTLRSDEPLTERPQTPQRTVWIDRWTPRADPLRGRVELFAQACASVGINRVVLPEPRRRSASFSKTVGDMSRLLATYAIDLVCMPASSRPEGAVVLGLTDAPCWMESHLHPYEWYVAGRLMWNPDLPDRRLAYEWLAQTFSDSPLFLLPMVDLMTSHGTKDPSEWAADALDTWRQQSSSVDSQRFAEVEESLLTATDEAPLQAP